MPLATVVPLPRDQPRLPVEFTAQADRPWNYESEEGQFYEATGQQKNIWFRRAAFTTPPPWALELQVTSSGKDSWPCFSRDYRKRWVLVWTRTDSGHTDVYRARSDDDGATWSNPTVPFPNGKYGFVLDDKHSGCHLEAAWVGEQVQALRRRSGELADTAFVFQDGSGAALLFANAGFCISVAEEGAGRWVMTSMMKGETAWSRWSSADDGNTWRRLI